MENEDRIAIKVQALSDLELAVLVCLVADQHCIIETHSDLMDDVEAELQLVNLIDSFSDMTLAETDQGRTRSVRPLLYCTDLYRDHHAR
jgi:hypothetical protein